mmetsp:Transcript_23794/g.35526  ORF Transcript_23794/g.35526 Transcript_23794/m.35526 type:complete len:90 (+) Transcript_23794:52-321(+)
MSFSLYLQSKRSMALPSQNIIANLQVRNEKVRRKELWIKMHNYLGGRKETSVAYYLKKNKNGEEHFTVKLLKKKSEKTLLFKMTQNYIT